MHALKRIMIIGQPGSGKSTLARALGERLGLPVIHVDRLHWRPGWIERSDAETTQLCREAEARDRWVFEGGHSQTWPSRLARADMLVCLDRGVGTRLFRVFQRALTSRGRSRPDMPDDCPERLRLLPDFLRYIWRTRHSGRVKMLHIADAASPECEVVHLSSDEEVAGFLAAVSPFALELRARSTVL